MHKHINPNQFDIYLPNPTAQLSQIFSQLKLFSKQRLDIQQNQQGSILNENEIRGLKFISSKLAKLFFKNRKLPYNQISKILIDNFASQQKDERNIKRRVYDAINVLVAAGILIKKNNSIEMIKNKIRTKIQTQRKDKIQQQIKDKIQNILIKKQIQSNLIQKHKLIKKLFNRNIKSNINNSMNNEDKDNMRKSVNISNIRRTKNNASNMTSSILSHKSLSRCIMPISLGDQIEQSYIYQPRVFIFSGQNIRNKKVESNIIRQYNEQNRISMIVPYIKKLQPMILQSHHGSQNSDYFNNIKYQIDQEFYHQQQQKQKQKQQQDKQQSQQKYQKDKQQKIDINDNQQLQKQQQERQQHSHNNYRNNKNNKSITNYGIYSLMDLLQLLSLNQIQEQ